MGAALEVVSARVVNPGATVSTTTIATGDSFNVRNFNPGADCVLVDVWGQQATKGLIRIRSPRLHDNVQGIRLANAAANPVPLLTGYQREHLYAQDTLTVEQSGDAADTDCVTWLNYYTDLPGTNARLYNWEEVQPRIAHVMGTEVDITTGGTKGDYGGATTINATFDQFKANTDYAILGYLTDTAVSTVGIKSADFGNLRIGGPGTNNKIETRDWFMRLDHFLPIPCIPVFNAANKGNTVVDLVANVTATAVVITFICAQLN